MSRFLLMVAVTATACFAAIGALYVALAFVRIDRSLEGFMRHRSWRRRLRSGVVVTGWVAVMSFLLHLERADLDACIEDAKGNKAAIEECRS